MRPDDKEMEINSQHSRNIAEPVGYEPKHRGSAPDSDKSEGPNSIQADAQPMSHSLPHSWSEDDMASNCHCGDSENCTSAKGRGSDPQFANICAWRTDNRVVPSNEVWLAS